MTVDQYDSDQMATQLLITITGYQLDDHQGRQYREDVTRNVLDTRCS